MSIENNMWIEKYRPANIADVILPERIRAVIDGYLVKGEIPSLIFQSESPGTGKTTSARAIANHFGVKPLFINASVNNSIDDVRTTIVDYATSVSLFGGKKQHRIVILDECLEENQEVLIGTVDNYKKVPLKDLSMGVVYDVVSFNTETGKFEDDTAELISEKEEEVFEVTLEDGSVVVMTANHPAIIRKEGAYHSSNIAFGLGVGDLVVKMGADVQELEIASIRSVGVKKVRNLTVFKNHTFVNGDGIVTHNCERISDAGQDALKGIIEQVSSNCRFILTANNFNRIIPALRSRCDEVDFNMNDAEKKEIGRLMFMHCQTILNAEGIPFQKEALAPLVMRYSPDNRTVLKKLQRFALQHGTIDSGIIAEMESGNLNDVIGFLKAKNFVGVRDWVFANADKVQSDVFRKMYRELDPIINPQTLPDLILILGEYQKHWAIVPDRLVHILAMMTEIMMRVQFKG